DAVQPADGHGDPAAARPHECRPGIEGPRHAPGRHRDERRL
ncbi:MAG: hypothetical protein AVDCRST_MAG18-4580, partial [uncultured Thermomicrobiales bacterium]